MSLYFQSVKFFPGPDPVCHATGRRHEWQCYEIRRPFLGSRVKYASLCCTPCRLGIELWAPTVDGLSLFDTDMMTRAANGDRVLAAFIQTFDKAAMARMDTLWHCDGFRQSFKD